MQPRLLVITSVLLLSSIGCNFNFHKRADSIKAFAWRGAPWQSQREDIVDSGVPDYTIGPVADRDFDDALRTLDDTELQPTLDPITTSPRTATTNVFDSILTFWR